MTNKLLATAFLLLSGTVLGIGFSVSESKPAFSVIVVLFAFFFGYVFVSEITKDKK